MHLFVAWPVDCSFGQDEFIPDRGNGSVISEINLNLSIIILYCSFPCEKKKLQKNLINDLITMQFIIVFKLIG